MRRLNKEFYEIHDFVAKSGMKMSILKLRNQMWKVIIHGPPVTKFEGTSHPFIIQFPEKYPFEPPMIYNADEDDRYPFLLGGNVAPFKILREKWCLAIPISLPITALYHLFIVNGKKKDNKENCQNKKVVPIDVPMIAVEAFEKTVVERVKTGTLSKSRGQALLELVKNFFRKNQNEEDIDKDLQKLHA
ncbi:unnamed protein product [Oikopleura dioica]|uniref:UBC core domain-containing protein n=1 Tax=Oikopleura dioica TaxID=34765 RepID=E4Z144_OIKDI|nr:unnamed protein product [Oikopleura dioica]CBY41923.1 unnamed protein product [Oikopleura dioica]